MSVKTNRHGQIQPRSETGKQGLTVIDRLEAMGPQLARALPKHMDPDRIVRIALTAMRNNEKLRQCTEVSFFGSLMQAAQMGLEPNTAHGYCYLIPYWNRSLNAFECQFQMGYKGMIELALRSGKVTSIRGRVVRQGDQFQRIEGLHANLVHIPDDDSEDRELTHAYAVAKLANGDALFECLTRKDIEQRRSRSAASSSGRGTPWDTDYEAMCKKTAVRALYTWLPQSTEMAVAAALDEAPEYGGSQRALWSPEVTRGLKVLGHESEDDDEQEDTETTQPKQSAPSLEEYAS